MRKVRLTVSVASQKSELCEKVRLTASVASKFFFTTFIGTLFPLVLKRNYLNFFCEKVHITSRGATSATRSVALGLACENKKAKDPMNRQRSERKKLFTMRTIRLTESSAVVIGPFK